MKLELKYQITCNGALMFERETPEEILTLWDENIKALDELEKEAHNRVKVYAFQDETNKYIPKGTITVILDGDRVFYELKTIITQL